MVDYLTSVDMLADPLTKGMGVELFSKHVSLIGLRDA